MQEERSNTLIYLQNYPEEKESLNYQDIIKHATNIHQWTTSQLDAFWERYIRNASIYHGTNSLALEQIQKEGALSPNNRTSGKRKL